MTSLSLWAKAKYGIVEAPPRFVYTPSTERPQLFLDTDIDSDSDDILDILLIMALHSDRSLDLAGVVTTSALNTTTGALLAIMHYYGFDQINIGHNPRSPGNTATGLYGPTVASTYGVSGRKTPSGFYPALSVQKYVLGAAIDHSIDYMTTGDLASVRQLLQDSSGAALIAQKIKALWVVGGYWPTGTGVSDFGGTAARAAVSDYVLQNWPSAVPIYLVDLHDGDTVLTGENVMVGLDSANPARVGWELQMEGSDPADTRPGWAQIAILAQAFGLSEGYMEIADSGVASVDPSTGASSFTSGAGNHHYLQKVMADGDLVTAINGYLAEP